MSVHTMFWEVNHTTTFAKTIYTNGLYQQKVDVGMLNAVKTIFCGCFKHWTFVRAKSGLLPLLL